MMKLLSRYALAWMIAAAWTTSNAAGAELAADKQQEIDALNESVSEAARLFKQGKFKDCADVVRRTQQTYETMAAGGGAVSPRRCSLSMSDCPRLMRCWSWRACRCRR